MFLENNRQIFDILQNCGKKKPCLVGSTRSPGFALDQVAGPARVRWTAVHGSTRLVSLCSLSLNSACAAVPHVLLLLVAAPRRGKFFAPRSLLFSVSSLLECFLVLRHLSFLSIRKKFLVILVLGAAFSTLRRWYGRSHRDLSTYSALLKVWNGGLMYVDLFFFFFFCFIRVAFR
jgi:hypothetical protein